MSSFPFSKPSKNLGIRLEFDSIGHPSMALTKAVFRLKPSSMPRPSTCVVKSTSALQSTFRNFSVAFTPQNSNDPFGFARPPQGASLKLRKPTTPPPPPTDTYTKPSALPQSKPSSTPIGSAIFQRMAASHQNQIQELKRFDKSNQSNRDEKATPDALWRTASQLKVQSHSGPLTPSSSRSVRTMKIPPTSFLNRAATAMDFERAYKRIQFMVNSSGLRKDIYLNKRYEKPFLKRRRLRSERHRTKFAIEVQRRVQIISVMKLRGM